MFKDKAEMWLYWMNRGWGQAPRIVRQIKRVLRRYNITKGKVLELGCGNGRITTNLARQGFDATGIDISQRYLEDARKRAAKLKVRPHFIRGDIRYVRRFIQGKYDAAISIWTTLGFYDRPTDEKIFRQVARLLKKKGVFMILYTMSRERLLSIFNPHVVQETDAYMLINKNTLDTFHSILSNKWVYYKKKKKDLIYVTEVDCDLRIYALPELVEMAENAGLKFRDAFHSLMTLEPARSDSPANLVFQKV